METAQNIGKTKLVLKQGDITEESVDIIVNAANKELAGGGGVDGAIHKAGGPAILEECDQIREEQGGCPTGEAVITTAGKLDANYVIHAVGPIWQGGSLSEDQLLQDVYRNSLSLAKQYGAKSIAFPSISTGAYRFPINRAASIALATIKEFAQQQDSFEEIRIILFSENDFQTYKTVLESLL